MEHKGTLRLSTPRLVLRPFATQDAEAVYRNWASDKEVVTYLTWPAHADVDVSRKIVAEWAAAYEKEDFYQWAIVPKTLGEPVGSIGAVRLCEDTGVVHIGYCIGRAWWHQGITSEALQELVRFFFEEVKVNKVESRHDPRNPNSGLVMQKCGLRPEGVLRAADRNNQGICDAAYYGILAQEYFAAKR